MGYSGKYVVDNVGSLLIFIIALPLLTLLLRLIENKTRNSKQQPEVFIQQFASQKYKSLKWSGLIQFFLNNYLVLGVVGQIGINNLTFGSVFSWAANYSSVLALLLVVWQVVLPVALFALLVTGYKPLVHPHYYNMVSKYGNDNILKKYLKTH